MRHRRQSKRVVRRSASRSAGAAPAPLHLGPVASAVGQGGRGLSAAERGYFEPRFRRDLGHVRLHEGAAAGAAAARIDARAFTLRNDIAFAPGQCDTGSPAGRRLIAHEIAHTFQPHPGPVIRRSCSDPEFCTPYATTSEADDAETSIWDYYMTFEGSASFGSEVRSLYESYLNRSPGDSLSPVVFDKDTYLRNAFRDSDAVADDMDAVLELVEARLSRGPGYPWRRGGYNVMSLGNFLSTSEMDERPINWSNPISVAGHIAGGIGGGDAGDDYRKITRANVSVERTELFGGTGFYTVRLIPHYEVFDTVDFCPGDCGAPLEQIITIPMSRLEASGRAFDQPFKVIFSPEPRSTRVWF